MAWLGTPSRCGHKLLYAICRPTVRVHCLPTAYAVCRPRTLSADHVHCRPHTLSANHVHCLPTVYADCSRTLCVGMDGA
jgi:hypothetical protein